MCRSQILSSPVGLLLSFTHCAFCQYSRALFTFPLWKILDNIKKKLQKLFCIEKSKISNCIYHILLSATWSIDFSQTESTYFYIIKSCIFQRMAEKSSIKKIIVYWRKTLRVRWFYFPEYELYLATWITLSAYECVCTFTHVNYTNKRSFWTQLGYFIFFPLNAVYKY